MVSRTLLLLLFALAATQTSAEILDCTTVDPGGCHILAYCEGTVESRYCTCQPGTIDKSGGQGLDCDKNAFSVRYVGRYDLPNLLGIADPSEVDLAVPADVTSTFCTADAQGYYLRSTRLGYPVNPLDDSVQSVVEVRCLYSEKSDAEAANYTAKIESLGGALVDPAVYKWTLPTTDAPLDIPPTGMVVNTVEFKPSCAETGCWVIKGTMTTGEAFNSFEVFNTLFLPQADISAEDPQGVLSYDYDYSDVEWTFAPAEHPCTSVAYQAGVSGNEKISTCCIDYPGVGTKGGFIPNYRPTQAFVNWADHLKCDEKFVDADGNDVCWRVYSGQEVWWTTADLRCKAAGGYLAIIDNADENERLRSLLAKRGVDRAWFGLLDKDDGDADGLKEDGAIWQPDFQWVDGSPLTFENWADEWYAFSEWCTYTLLNSTDLGQDFLQSWKLRCEESDYVMMESVNGTWLSDRQAGNEMPFVCAFDPPTECISHVIQRPRYSKPEPSSETCLEVHNRYVFWDQAQATCNASGGQLVSFDDLEDYFHVWRLIDEHDMFGSWLGLTDTEVEGAWTWVDGDSFNHVVDWYEAEAFYWYYTLFYDYSELSYYYYDYKYVDYYDFDQLNAERDCAYIRKVDAQLRQQECGDKTEGVPFICEVPRDRAVTCDSDGLTSEDGPWDIPFPLQYQKFFGVGKFKGMDVSPGIVDLTQTDPFFGQFKFEIQLDEVELRTKAGKLRGTVGVEHTVDTFLGLANFRPTGIAALDTFATQTAIHLEKTSFFSVSTHGENEYTFLEYVNMRLVQVLDEDSDFSGASGAGTNDDEAGARTVRTDTEGNACYVQVTFTLGQQYQPNKESGGLIPADSVRAGTGTFMSDVDAAGNMEQVCSVYKSTGSSVGLTAGSYDGDKAEFNRLVGQDCGPTSLMCESPEDVPDQFVSFNVPLGFEVFDGRASNDLSQQIFVDLVVNAVDTSATGTPNNGDAPMQMKTTLTASIPIVAGGINIFCDGITAKTDLKDVANVDIVVGTANSPAELTRLRILEDVASTVLATKAPSQINTDSIESALMTLVIKGNESYFTGSGRNTVDYTMELDDVITLHMMEDGVAQTSSKEAAVQALLDTPGADNSDSNGIDTDGYSLNGAFYFTVNRVAGTASLEPSTSLLSHCPFNPPRPVDGNQLETCVTRRDVKLRDYPLRAGAVATAMEILASADPKESSKSAIDTMAEALDETSDESTFLTTILGASDYTKDLAPDFVRAIHDRYELNGRFRRAYWINPGYEWTPTQTAGKSRFQVSQKIFLFALISLDENWTRRRMLLQASSQDAMSEAGAGMGQAAMQFKVTPKSMMASAFGVHEDFVAAYDVELQLTRAEACMLPTQRQSAVRSTLEGYLATAASKHHTVQVTKMSVDLGDELCDSRRALRKLHATFSSATASIRMLIVFSEDETPKFNVEAFAKSAGINSATAAADSSLPPSLEDRTYIKIDEDEDEDEDSSSMPMTLIAGVCGGVGAVVVMVAGVILYRRSKRESEPEVVQCISLEDIKGELSFDNGAVCHQSSFEGEAPSWDKALAAS